MNRDSEKPELQEADVRDHVDGSLVRHLLSLSPEQRIESHEAARILARDLAKAGKEHYARRSKSSTSKANGQ